MPHQMPRLPTAERQYQTLVTGYRRSVTKLISNYKKLAPKIDKICRLMEAKKLFDMTKKWGNADQKYEVVRLIKTNRFGIYLQCSCDDSECDWANFNEQDETTYCECIDNNSMNCHGIYVAAFDDDGNQIGETSN